jgi:hypothetical protein
VIENVMYEKNIAPSSNPDPCYFFLLGILCAPADQLLRSLSPAAGDDGALQTAY